MTREIAHQKSFEKALYSIENNFPPGKLPGIAAYANAYVNTSQGDGDMDGAWNSGDQWDRIDDIEKVMPFDDGDGTASVKLTKKDSDVAAALASRTRSDPKANLATGADIGAGPGAGRMTDEDLGGADDINDAVAQADAMAE